MKEPRVGILFELLDDGPAIAGPSSPHPLDWNAEYEPERTICTLEGALRKAGCEPVRIGSAHDLLGLVGGGDAPSPGTSAEGRVRSKLSLRAALNISEGYGSRNREGWAPALLEMLGIPCLGSDALTLSLSLDKAWCKRFLAEAGVPTTAFASIASMEGFDQLVLPGDFPLFVKPRWEGTAKGISPTSRVETHVGLKAAVENVIQTYGQPALVEPFLPGAEYTVTVVGNDGIGRGARCLPVLQRALEVESGIGVHALERHDPAEHDRSGWEHIVPGDLSSELERELVELSLRVYRALECKDFARIDFRLDADGAVQFLEINTLPTFDPEASFGILAELQGLPVELLLGEIFAEGLERLGVLREGSLT